MDNNHIQLYSVYPTHISVLQVTQLVYGMQPQVPNIQISFWFPSQLLGDGCDGLTLALGL